MKKAIIAPLAIIFIAMACKSKQATTTSTIASPGIDAQLAAVQVRFPDATKDELQKGHDIYTGACTKCHDTKDVIAYAEPKLLEIVDVMAGKAHLTAPEKQALIRFAVGVRATSK